MISNVQRNSKFYKIWPLFGDFMFFISLLHLILLPAHFSPLLMIFLTKELLSVPFIFVTCISLYNFNHYLTKINLKMCVMGNSNDPPALISSWKFLNEKTPNT